MSTIVWKFQGLPTPFLAPINIFLTLYEKLDLIHSLIIYPSLKMEGTIFIVAFTKPIDIWPCMKLEQKTDNKHKKFQDFINKEEFSNNHNFCKIYLELILKIKT
jgi:hypothetical protein